MTTPEITYERLRQIIKEELGALQEGVTTEAVDHKGINGIVSVASKLLAAVEGFKEKAPPAAINAVTPHLGELEKMLENMVSNPGSYVPVPKKELKRVTLKAVKGEAAQKAMAEATGGDGKLERVGEGNWQHLEVGNTYLVKAGRDRVKSAFVGWVDKQGNPTESEDPEQVDLRFADVDDGMAWEAYWFEGHYSVGSGADTLYVKELD